MKKIVILIATILLALPLFSARISGKVTLEKPFERLEDVSMNGVIQITPSPGNTDGRTVLYPLMSNGFSFELPDGDYRLIISQQRYGAYVSDFTIAGENNELEIELKLVALSGTYVGDIEFEGDYIVLPEDEAIFTGCLTVGEHTLSNAGSLTIEPEQPCEKEQD